MADDIKQPQSLNTTAARTLTTTTKSVPQMQGISSRWLLRILPWVQVSGGTYRVNRRLTYSAGTGRVSFANTGAAVKVIPQTLRELPLFRGFADDAVLTGVADKFAQREFQTGDVLAESGKSAGQIYLIAHGKMKKLSAGHYDVHATLGVLADGEYFGEQSLLETPANWEFTVKAITGGTLLTLSREQFQDLLSQSPALKAQVEQFRTRSQRPQNKHGEAAIEVAAGHKGEPDLPGTFADYETAPREYPLSIAQTVLQVHTRVADLYNEPINQLEEQIRLTIQELRERQEDELINNREFGLLHNAEFKQRISTHAGPPTPDDLDELISRRRKTRYLLAHPLTISAFGRECNARGIYPQSVEVNGVAVPAWRGVPLLTSNKIPISSAQTSSILALRTGLEDQGVIGLHQTGIPDEREPGLSVRFMGISEKAIISYLVSAYHSVAVLVPDALGILENVEIGR